MADYIRRDIVLKIINTVNDTGGFAGYADYCVLFDEIDTMPAADVQPVKRGRWDYSEEDNGECEWYFCSECDSPAEQLYTDEPLLSEFCPHCGADMRGED